MKIKMNTINKNWEEIKQKRKIWCAADNDNHMFHIM